MNIKEYDEMNQKLIDRYIDKQKNDCTMLISDDFSDFKPRYRESAFYTCVGRDKYHSMRRYDALYLAKGDIKQTDVRKITLANFYIIDMKIERILARNCSVMNGTFKDTTFFRFSIFRYYESNWGGNEYHDMRSIVMNCQFENCVFMNSYARHTDWINCKFINCKFINSNLSDEGSEEKDCTFENCRTIYLKA